MSLCLTAEEDKAPGDEKTGKRREMIWSDFIKTPCPLKQVVVILLTLEAHLNLTLGEETTSN